MITPVHNTITDFEFVAVTSTRHHTFRLRKGLWQCALPTGSVAQEALDDAGKTTHFEQGLCGSK
jgi:hypothetical protein